MLFQKSASTPRGMPAHGDLQKLVAAVKPQKVVPIHTFFPERYDELFQNAETHEDGEWWEV